MRKFFEEFKAFATRGNVIDMAVGVTVGGAFTAIVNAISNSIIKPFINWLIALMLGSKNLSESFTMLKPAYMDDAVTGEKVIDLANSIYIDWGAFILAIINFFVIAFVLFCVVKAINTFNEKQKEVTDKLMSNVISCEDRKAMKAQGIKASDKAAVKAYFEAKAEAEAKAKAEEEEKARLERLENPTTEELLKDIRELLRNK